MGYDFTNTKRAFPTKRQQQNEMIF